MACPWNCEISHCLLLSHNCNLKIYEVFFFKTFTISSQQKSIQACKILSFLKPKLHGFYDVRNRQWQVYCFWLDKKLSMNSIHVELKWVSEFGTPFGPLCFFFLMPSFWSCPVNWANTGFDPIVTRTWQITLMVTTLDK